MPLLTPLWMQTAEGGAVEYAAQLDRIGLASIFTEEGVVGPEYGNLKVRQRAEGANFSIDVDPGYCVIKGDDISDQGVYICASTTVINLPIPAKPASGTRTHRVIAQVYDPQSNSAWSDYGWEIRVLQDQGTGLPDLPPTAISLYTVSVSSATVSIVAGNIGGAPHRAIVGTPDRKGTFQLNPVVWRASQPTRDLSYSVNSEGWVSLAGWVTRVGPTFLCRHNVLYDENPGYRLPTIMRPVGAVRDVCGYSHAGTFHWQVWPDGMMRMRWPSGDMNLVKDVAWLTFDGLGYRIK